MTKDHSRKKLHLENSMVSLVEEDFVPSDEANSDGEIESEIKHYLDKLKEIVPMCPKHKKVTRLELIQHVIDYICDLQQALEDRANLCDLTIDSVAPPPSPSAAQKAKGTPRQPLGVLLLPENKPVENQRIQQLNQQRRQIQHSKEMDQNMCLILRHGSDNF